MKLLPKTGFVLISALFALSAQAQDLTGTLKKIKDSGAVTMGVRESSGALSYTLGDGKYAGFHVEICQRVLGDIQKSLGQAKLDVKYQPVTSQNRIPLVQNGTVDIECARPPTTPPARRSCPSRSPPMSRKCASRCLF